MDVFERGVWCWVCVTCYIKKGEKAGGRIKRHLYENGLASVCFRRPFLRAIHIVAYFFVACVSTSSTELEE